MKYREACATRDGAECDDVYWNKKASMKFTSIEEGTLRKSGTLPED